MERFPKTKVFLPASVASQKCPIDVRRGAAGFSLIELLVVIALICVLASATGPVLGSMFKGGSMNRAVTDISSVLEQAQSYAMAHNTYVWVGFNENVATRTMTVAAIAGTTGAATDIAVPANLRAVIRQQTYENLRLQTDAELAEIDLKGMRTGKNVAKSSIGTFTQGTKTFASVIEFSPLGGARIESGPMSRWIQLGLQGMSGAHVEKSNVAALQLAGLTGQVRIFRP